MKSEKIQVNTSKGLATINYSDFDKLIEMLIYQKRQVFEYTCLSTYYNKYWRLLENLKMFELPNNAKVLDVGCGNSIMDFILYQYATNPTIYLLDKHELKYPRPAWVDQVENYQFYHLWDVVEDAIASSNFNKDNFVFLSPEDIWPQDLDLITSYGSWGWHYPFSTYWPQARESLKVGGKLSIDLSDNANSFMFPSVIDMVSEDFADTPIIHRKTPSKDTTKNSGCRIIWTRRR